jgi:uncharacterized protein (TIRG00374 family)
VLGLCLHAVGLVIPVPTWFLVFLAINLLIAAPSTPGQVGVLEAGAVLILRALGQSENAALAFGALYHLVHLLPETLLGVFAMRRVGRRPAAERAGA